MSTILVTGASGFIGVHLTSVLLSMRQNVISVGRHQSEGNGASSVLKDISQDNSPKKIIINDFQSNTEWVEALQGVDIVVHLAGLAHDIQNKKWGLADYEKVNTKATEAIARAAAKVGVKRFIFISTIKVCGENTPLDEPFSEKSPPSPEGPYSVSKYEAEIALRTIADETGLEVAIIRPPLVYGFGVKGNMRQLIQTITKRHILPAPSLKNLRSFIYVGNLVDAIITTMEHPAASGETFAVSDGQDVSTVDLIKLISRSMRLRNKILPISKTFLSLAGKSGDVVEKIIGKPVMFNSSATLKIQSSLRVNSSKIKETLGWTPPYTLEQGVKEMVRGVNGGTQTVGSLETCVPAIAAPEIDKLKVKATPNELKLTASPVVSVVIVNFNAGEFLTKCVQSVLRSDISVEIIVSDNKSTDGSIQFLRNNIGADPRLHIVENNANIGFAKANNVALSHAIGKDLLFLNPDCIIDSDTISRMSSHVTSNPEVGMAGCLVTNLDGTEQAGCRRMIPTPWRVFVRTFNLNKLFPNHPSFQNFVLVNKPLPNKPIHIEALSGAFMFVRREALLQVGPLDNNYFMHCEDLDWCVRFTETGWKILFVPEVKITHVKGECGRDRPLRVLWHKHRGMVRFYRKYFQSKYSFPVIWLITTAVWARFVAFAIPTIFKALPGVNRRHLHVLKKEQY